MKKIRKITAVFSFVIILMMLLASCSKGNAFDAEMVPKPEYDGFVGDTSGSNSNGADKITNLLGADRKIIKTVHESVQTDAYDSFVSSLAEAVASVGGYVSTKEEQGDSYYNSQTLRYSYYTIRIPAERLDEFTKSIDGLAVVTSYNESMLDVTEAYVDVESRIAVYESERIALLEMLEKSENVDTLLEIRTKLLAVESDLASLKAQKASYDSRVAHSTVYLRLYEVRRAVSENPGFFEEIGAKFSDSLYGIGEGVRDLAVWFIGNILYILLLSAVGVGIFFLVRFIYKKRRERREEKKAENENMLMNNSDADGTEDVEENNLEN